MSKLFVVCPNCKAKYAVANKDIAGKYVGCKSCSQKFVAKIYVAAPAKVAVAAAKTPSSLDASDSQDSDLFGSGFDSDDLYANMPAPSSAGPTLASLPPARRKASSSSRSLPIVPIALAVGGVALLAVLVMVGVSIASSAGDWGISPLPDLSSGSGGYSSGSSWDGGQSNNEQANFQQHHQVLDKQMVLMNRFIAAMESVGGEADLPQFVTTVNGLTAELREVAKLVGQLPKVSKENNQKLSEEAERRTKEFIPRMKAAGQKMAQYNQHQNVTNAMLGFQAAGKEVSNAINSAKERFANSPAPRVVASSAGRPTQRLTDFQARYGFENCVMFKTPEMNGKQGAKIKEILGPVLVDIASGQQGNGKESTLELHYKGEINDLLPLITFGEIARVDVQNRCIYMKSVTLPKE